MLFCAVIDELGSRRDQLKSLVLITRAEKPKDLTGARSMVLTLQYYPSEPPPQNTCDVLRV